MERLTEMNENGTAHFYPQCFEKCGGIGYSRKCDDCDLLDRVCDKLGEYEDLEEQEKLLKLPCAVGDTVYRINKGKKEPVIPMEVIGIAIRNENKIVIQTKDIADDNHNLYSKNSISKTVFLTREEAEAALKKMEEKRV